MRLTDASRAPVIDCFSPYVGLDLCDKPCGHSRGDGADACDPDEHEGDRYESACGRNGKVIAVADGGG